MKKVFMVGCVIATAFTAVAMPTNKDLATARPLVEDITSPYIKDLQAGKTTAAEVAKKHMTLAEKAQNDAERYLLFQGAFKLYVRGEDYDAAAEALTAMCENVEKVPPEVVIEIVNKEMRRVAGEKAPKVLTIFRDAKKAVNCRKDLAEADKLLKSNPRDPNLHKKRGDSLAALGDWKGALAAFRKADGAVKKMADAEAEAKGGVPPDEIADFWWDYVAAQPEEYALNFRIHAAMLYEKALASGTVTGLSKVQAERRVKDVNGYGESFFDVARAGNSMYCVIDLSAGASAEKYPVTYMNKPPNGGFNVDEYKTTKLVLRLIKPGYLKIDDKHSVTIAKPFYCGIFEVTQSQYGLVMGNTGYAVDATYTTSCVPPPMIEVLGLGLAAIARPASL